MASPTPVKGVVSRRALLNAAACNQLRPVAAELLWPGFSDTVAALDADPASERSQPAALVVEAVPLPSAATLDVLATRKGARVTVATAARNELERRGQDPTEVDAAIGRLLDQHGNNPVSLLRGHLRRRLPLKGRAARVVAAIPAEHHRSIGFEVDREFGRLLDAGLVTPDAAAAVFGMLGADTRKRLISGRVLSGERLVAAVTGAPFAVALAAVGDCADPTVIAAVLGAAEPPDRGGYGTWVDKGICAMDLPHEIRERLVGAAAPARAWELLVEGSPVLDGPLAQRAADKVFAALPTTAGDTWDTRRLLEQVTSAVEVASTEGARLLARLALQTPGLGARFVEGSAEPGLALGAATALFAQLDTPERVRCALALCADGLELGEAIDAAALLVADNTLGVHLPASTVEPAERRAHARHP